MISKITSPGSFSNCCRYVCQKEGAKVLLAEGVRDHDHKLMAADFQLQAELRPSKSHACMHAVLSFHPSENPSDELMKDIAKKYLEGMGVKDTQYAIIKHTDKAHPHLHIVVNMVDNRGKAISDSWTGLRGKKEAERLTMQYKLVPAMKKDLKMTHLEALSQKEALKYEVYMAIAAALPGCRTMEELEKKLSLKNIEVQYKMKGQTEERQGISFRVGEYCFKGSQIDRSFSFGGLEKTISLQCKQELKQGEKNEQTRSEKAEKNSGLQLGQKITNKPVSEEIATKESIVHHTSKETILDILVKPMHQDESIPYPYKKDKRKKEKKQQSLGLRY